MFHRVPFQSVLEVSTTVTDAVMLALGATVTVAPPSSVTPVIVEAACAPDVNANKAITEQQQRRNVVARHIGLPPLNRGLAAAADRKRGTNPYRARACESGCPASPNGCNESCEELAPG